MFVFVYHARSIPIAGAVCFFSRFVSPLLGPEIFRLISQRSCRLSENTTQRITAQGHIWMNAEGGSMSSCIKGDQRRRKLILHQVSSIFSGSGSLGRRSLDTRKKVCTARPPGGLYGKRRLRSPPASRLQIKYKEKESASCVTYQLVLTLGLHNVWKC